MSIVVLTARADSFRTGFLCLLGCCFFFFSLSAQHPTYAPPVRGPLLVTGTFGELRSDHFHAGLDLRAPTGTPVYAVADGYVSRLRISAGGYGQAVYLDHPEGYRTVYGHLNSLREDFMDTIRTEQYAQERFTLDLRFDSLAFPVKQGDQIGTIGNRGYSFGPHLHFEVRSQETDAALNPLSFGINVPDTRHPQLRKIKVYELDQDLHTTREQFIDLDRNRGGGDYVLPGQLVEVYSPRVGLGIKAYDQQNAMPNYNGIVSAELYQDSALVHAFRYDSIPFEETRYLNAHTDYRDWNQDQSWYHRLHRLPGDGLCFYEVSQITPSSSQKSKNGVMMLRPNEPQAVQVVVKDWAGNASTVAFSVVYRTGELTPMGAPYQYDIPYDEPSIVSINDLYLEVPAGAFYQNTKLTYQRAIDEGEEVYSAVHHLHEPLTPIHKPLRLRIASNQFVADSLRPNLVVARCLPERQSRPVSYGAALKEDGSPAFVEILEFGDYCLMLDTVPPTITPKEISGPLHRRSRISFVIEDNFAISGQARGLRYRATLNGKWLLMEYDLKKDLLFHEFEKPLPAGEHVLELKVMDDRGNEAVYRKKG